MTIPSAIYLPTRPVKAGVIAVLFFSFVMGMGLAPAVAAQEQAGNAVYGTATIVDMQGLPLADHSDVVVFLDGLIARPQVAPQVTIPRVSHRGRQFSPHVLPIVQGDQVDFYNDDSIYHNVFSLSAAKPFDLGIYPEGSSKLVRFEKPGIVKLHCNIHPGMISNVLVLNNPYFAVTDKKGNFVINNVPDGTFTLRSWHELSTEQSVAINLSGGESHQQDIQMKVSKRLKQHKNKFGKNYKTKY